MPTDNKYSVDDVIGFSLHQKPAEVSDALNSLMLDKIRSEIFDKKIELAKSLYGGIGPEESEEDFEDENDDDIEDDLEDDDDSDEEEDIDFSDEELEDILNDLDDVEFDDQEDNTEDLEDNND